MPAAHADRQARRLAARVHAHLGGQAAHLLLHRLQPDHAVELGEQLGQRSARGVAAHAHSALAGGGQIRGREFLQVALAVGEPGGLRGYGLLEQHSGRATVGEALTARDAGHPIRQRGQQVVGEAVFLSLGHRDVDLRQLVVGVVRKLDAGAEARAQAGVGVEEVLHLLGVARGDHHEVLATILQLHQQFVDRLLPEVAVVALGQRVRLVDEQHAAQRPLNLRPGLGRGLADVSDHQIGALGLHQVPLRHHAQGAVDLRDQPGHSGFGRPGVTGEHQVPAARRHRQARRSPPRVHLDLGGQRTDPLLHRLQADHAVQLGHQLVQGLARLPLRLGHDLEPGQMDGIDQDPAVRSGGALDDGGLAGLAQQIACGAGVSVMIAQVLGEQCPRGIGDRDVHVRHDLLDQGGRRGGLGQIRQRVYQCAADEFGCAITDRAQHALCGTAHDERAAGLLISGGGHERLERFGRVRVVEQHVGVLDEHQRGGLGSEGVVDRVVQVDRDRAPAFGGARENLGTGGVQHAVQLHAGLGHRDARGLGQARLPRVGGADEQHHRIRLILGGVVVAGSVGPADHADHSVQERGHRLDGDQRITVRQRLHCGERSLGWRRSG